LSVRADGPSAAGLPAKLYFRIGEVAELIGVEPHVLRYWEREFRTIRPTKSRRGQRVYSRRDVETLARIRALLYDEGFTIAGAKRKLSAGAPARQRAAMPRLARERLVALRDEIAAFLAELEPRP
jgi:DNA-binding transcriptional MerR regulator